MKLSSGSRKAWLDEGSIKNIYLNSVLYLYGITNSMPAHPDDAELGTLMAIITANGLPFESGVATNGLNFAAAATHNADYTKTYLSKDATLWKGVALADGPIRYGRLYANTVVQGASHVARRLDGSVLSVEGGDFLASTLTAKIGVEIVVTGANLLVAVAKNY
jgi:Zn-dependent protease